MSVTSARTGVVGRVSLWLPDLGRSVESLLMHKLRTLLTMLGMIFGVAAVLAMLSIGAGAQQQVMSFIEDLGVRNLIVEAHDNHDRDPVASLYLICCRHEKPPHTLDASQAETAVLSGKPLSS